MPMHFDLTDLKLVVNIADLQSMTRGAEQSCLSLPAASIRIKNLETNFGSQLFYRTNHGISLTPAGDAFMRHARTMLAQAEQFRGDMQDFGQGIKGHVRVFANTTAMTEFMPDALQEYLSTHPNVDVQLRERLSYLIVKAVAEGSADIGIVAGRPGTGNVEFFPYRENRLVLVTPEDHPLAARESLSFAETLDYNYVGLSEWSAIHPFLLQAASNLGSPLKFRVEVGNFEAVARMIEAHVGIGVIPGAVAARLQSRFKIKLISLTEPWAERMLYVCVRDIKSLPTFAADLVRLLLRE
jgi:DNA-binding transcriptional LysR family regulator